MTDRGEVMPYYHSLSGNTEEDKKLLEPYEYISRCTNKHLYTKFTLAFNYWLKISPDKLRQIDEIINICFNVNILLDDIQDNSISRDGFPVAHSIYGLSNTINATNYVQFIVLEKVINLHSAAIKILIEELLEYNRGQGFDMYWKENFICPSINDYKIMAIRKTSWVLKLAVRLMQLFSTCEENFSSLISVMGLHYQIHNDYCNLCKDINDKSYCDDLTEGKFNFLFIHALTKNPDDKQIMNILKQRTTNIEMKRYCVKLLESYGSFEYTRNIIKELDLATRAEIEHLGGNPLFVKIMDSYEIPYPDAVEF